MTCIVGVEHQQGVTLGADSCGAAGGRTTHREDPKIFRLERTATCAEHDQGQEVLIGYTTSYRMGQLLRYSLELPYHPAEMEPMEWLVTRFVTAVRDVLSDGGWLKKTKEREQAGCFLVGYRGQLFHVERDLQVGRYGRGYAAAGSGAEVALGSLRTTRHDTVRARDRCSLALSAAAAHNAYVAPPFQYVELNRRREAPDPSICDVTGA